MSGLPCSYLCTGGGDNLHRSSFFFRNSLSFTHEVARKAAISLRTSISLRVVSPNPGVSIKVTRRPSRSKGSATCTVLVPGPRFAPLTRLMNCTNHRQARGKFTMSLLSNTQQLAGKEATTAETAYRRFSAFYRTHHTIRPSELMDRPRSMRDKAFI